MTVYTPEDWARLATAIQATPAPTESAAAALAVFLDGCADWTFARTWRGLHIWKHREYGSEAGVPAEGEFPDDGEIQALALATVVRCALRLGTGGFQRNGSDPAVSRLAAVLTLHHPDGHEYRQSQGSTQRCTCGLPHPCPTFRALFPAGTVIG